MVRRVLISIVLVPLLLAALGAGRADAQPPLPAPLSGHDVKLYAAAFKEAARGNWKTAHRIASSASDQLGAKLLRWMEYSRPYNYAAFDEVERFIRDNPDWPRPNSLAAAAEAGMTVGVSDETVLEWYRWHDPVSRDGRLRLAEALLKTGEKDRATALIREAWVRDDFSRKDLRYVYRRFKKFLRPEDHIARLDRLVWQYRPGHARRMYRYVDEGHKRLAQARLALRAFRGGVDAAIARVPEELRDSAGLMYERLRWRRRKGRDEDAREILHAAPEDLGNRRLWWRERAIQVRNALNDGLISEAYRLASEHKQIDSSTFSEAEWLAGWIALRFLADPTNAYRHFSRLHGAVYMPISRARAGYWAGRAAEATGDKAGATQWYEEAAKHPGTFYGQLAAARLGEPDKPYSAARMEPNSEAGPKLVGHELFASVRLLAYLGEEKLLVTFLDRLTQLAKTHADHALIAQATRALGRPDLGVRAAKRALRDGFASNERLFPLVDLDFTLPNDTVEHSLVLAVTRQESAFNAKAISHAGARGLMQLMPGTARMVARHNRLHYARASLTRDPAYNVRLGSAHLSELLTEFDGSYVLAIAAYNAGSKNVRRWLERNGDPRKDPFVDVVDWIELIPLPETRNYVQRVLEGLQIYRWQLGQTVVIASIEQDLARGISGSALASRCVPSSSLFDVPVADLAAIC